jgi:hypothetical protein
VIGGVMIREVGNGNIGIRAGLPVIWVVSGVPRFNIDSGGATTIKNLMD